MILLRFILVLIAFPSLAMGADSKIKGDPNPDHIQELIDHHQRGGKPNTAMLVLKNKSGNIYQSILLKTLHNATKDFLSLPNVDRHALSSLMASGFSYIDEDGNRVVLLGREPTPEMMAAIKRKVRTANVIDPWVSDDETATAIAAQFFEHDPLSGAEINHSQIRRELEAIQKKYKTDGIRIHALDFFEENNQGKPAPENAAIHNKLLPEDLPNYNWVQDLASCRISWGELESHDTEWSYYAQRIESDLVPDGDNFHSLRRPLDIFGFPVDGVNPGGLGMAPGFAALLKAPFDVVSSSIEQQTGINLSTCVYGRNCAAFEFSEKRTFIAMGADKDGLSQTVVGCVYPYRR